VGGVAEGVAQEQGGVGADPVGRVGGGGHPFPAGDGAHAAPALAELPEQLLGVAALVEQGLAEGAVGERGPGRAPEPTGAGHGQGPGRIGVGPVAVPAQGAQPGPAGPHPQLPIPVRSVHKGLRRGQEAVPVPREEGFEGDRRDIPVGDGVRVEGRALLAHRVGHGPGRPAEAG
jgi:hypothetical protein